MPLLITEPNRIPVPGGKSIDEYVGRVRTNSSAEFDEITLVLSGTVQVECDGATILVGAGQALITYAGERVRFTAAETAEYVAICLPAFGPDLAHRDPE